MMSLMSVREKGRSGGLRKHNVRPAIISGIPGNIIFAFSSEHKAFCEATVHEACNSEEGPACSRLCNGCRGALEAWWEAQQSGGQQ